MDEYGVIESIESGEIEPVKFYFEKEFKVFGFKFKIEIIR